MKQMAYVIYREDEFFVSQCLNVDVSSLGATREEAVANLKEAAELYFEGESEPALTGDRAVRASHDEPEFRRLHVVSVLAHTSLVRKVCDVLHPD